MSLSIQTTTTVAIAQLRTLATDFAMAASRYTLTGDHVTACWARDLEMRLINLADRIEAEAIGNGILPRGDA
ncbi:hypothetical protein SAMN05661010_00044 [Modicisalibacter muralis]|uniref:Uncharacterized protein n=1 Tax=Modicisalibacter muralis TaxID=119000 RepID=A0A1G9ENH3_9GAMM|nr:hypothetical protein [Halomonas muralis]SDK77638.1 hypothetical protein SAMN05661010_00044 [Halomonas muralis]